jgi:hypothetical protein
MSNNKKNKIDVWSLSDEQFTELLRESQKFMKTKLIPCFNENNVTDYWTCGVDHHNQPRYYDPYKNIMKFCVKKNLDWDEFKKRIEEYSNENIFCECFIVNHVSIKAV